MPTNLNLLHVEDDDGDARIVQRALSSEFHSDYAITRVATLHDAIQQLKKVHYDAVLLDLNLADARGLENVRAVREENPDLPIVVLTGEDNNDMALMAVRSGAQEYMVKDHSSSRTMGLAVLSSIERKAYERLLFRMANHDELTGLPNRRMFLEYLNRCLIRAAVWQRTEAVLFLDLNGFKKVNDTYGHDKGDELLVQVAARLKEGLRPSDLLARFGGDEFVIHLDTAAHVSNEACVEIANRIASLFTEPISLGFDRVAVGVSIGIALYPNHAQDSAQLIECADRAMYEAKRNRLPYAFASSPVGFTHPNPALHPSHEITGKWHLAI
jgi:diguanylate cyclase (GGDEF)-like protein